MVGWVPILRCERVIEAGQQSVDHRHHGVAVGHGKLATRHEGGLQVH
jgi:hypothetical protein